MQNPFFYPGKGLKLRQVVSETDSRYADPVMSNTTIAAGEYTEWIAAHDCLELTFLAEFVDPATGDVVVERRGVDAADEYSSDTLAAQNTWSWNAGEPLTGEFRVFNDTDKDATITVQKRIN